MSEVRIVPVETDIGVNWLWMLAGGVFAVLLGFVVLIWRTETLYALTYFAGAMFMAIGLIRLASVLLVPERRLLSLLASAGFLAVGIILVVWPHITLFIATLLIALGFTVWGVLELVTAFGDTRARHWWVALIAGIASLIVAIWTIRHPGNALNVLMILLGIWIMLWGAAEIAVAMVARHVHGELSRES